MHGKLATKFVKYEKVEVARVTVTTSTTEIGSYVYPKHIRLSVIAISFIIMALLLFLAFQSFS